MTAIAGPILVHSSPVQAAAPEPIEAVLTRLDAPVRRCSAHPLWSSLGAVCTFGLLPLWIWPQRWEAAAEADRRDYSALAAWWGRQSPAAAGRLDAAARRLGRGSGINALLLTGVAVATSLLLTWTFLHGVPLAHLGEIVYQQRRVLHMNHGRPHSLALGELWTGVLVIAYGLHYLHVRSHAAAVKRFLSAVDAAGQSVGMRWPTNRYTFRGIGVMWILCGLALCGAGQWWGAPLVLAGARQRQYLRRVRPAMRMDLANQARAAMGRQPVHFGRCVTTRCRAPLPPTARFCPRCGAAA